MTRNEFIENFIKDVKIRIHNRHECYEFQRIAFEFGVRVHSEMNSTNPKPIAYNIADVIPEDKGKSFATDMTNLVIYDSGTRLQKSGFFFLENDKREIFFDEFINAYNSIQ